MNLEQAQRRARLELGSLPQLQQECLDVRRIQFLGAIRQDLFFAARIARKNAGLSSFLILVFALGIGGCTAVWSTLQTVVLQGLPYRHPDSLVALWEQHPLVGRQEVSSPDFLDWRAQDRSFQHMSAYTMAGESDMTLSGSTGKPEVVHATLASVDLLSTLGVSVVCGRNFRPADETGPKVALLSSELWHRRFHADPAIIGQPVEIDRALVTIIGVLPNSVRYPEWADLWLPLNAATLSQQRMYHVLEVVARLRPGISLETARQEFLATVARLRRQHPFTNGATGGLLVSLQEQELGETKAVLLLLSGAAALVLLIVCAIVANLLLSKAAARQHEFEVRRALGASTIRLMQQILIETLLLALCGTAFGCGLAVISLAAAKRQFLTLVPYAERWRVDRHFFFLALGACLFASLFCAGLQVLGAMRSDSLRAGHRTTGKIKLLRTGLIAAQTAFTFAVLMTTGLLTRSLYNIVTTDLGLQVPGVLTFRLTLPSDTKQGDLYGFYSRLTEKIMRLPGLTGVALSSTGPFQPQAGRFFVDGQPEPRPGHYPVAQFRNVSPSFLPFMGIRLVRGRLFQQRDIGSSSSIINETLARRYYPDSDPIGRSVLEAGGGLRSSSTIIGVVKDAKDLGPESEIKPTVYRCDIETSSTVLVRSKISAVELMDEIRNIVQKLDPELAISEVQTIQEAMDARNRRRNVTVWLCSCFSLLALLLSMLGVYSVVFQSITARRKEIGIRMTVGARPIHLYSQIGYELSRALGFGLLMGLLLAMAGTPLTRSLLFRVSFFDGSTGASALSVILISAVTAGLIGMRALRKVEPSISLRES